MRFNSYRYCSFIQIVHFWWLLILLKLLELLITVLDKYLRRKDFQANMHLMQNANLPSVFVDYFVSLLSLFHSNQLSFLIKAEFYLVCMILITRPMNCFHAENAYFSVHFPTCEEGFITFLKHFFKAARKM